MTIIKEEWVRHLLNKGHLLSKVWENLAELRRKRSGLSDDKFENWLMRLTDKELIRLTNAYVPRSLTEEEQKKANLILAYVISICPQ